MLRLALALATLLVLVPSLATAQDGPATRALRSRYDRAVTILARDVSTDAERATRETAIAAIVNELVDFDAVAQASVGDAWSSATPAEREEFTALRRRSFERAYLSNLESTRDYNVTYTGEDETADGRVVHMVLRSRIAPRSDPHTADYVMRLVAGEWRVVDIVFNEASQATGQRSQFRRVIAQQGWPALIAQVRTAIERHGH